MPVWFRVLGVYGVLEHVFRVSIGFNCPHAEEIADLASTNLSLLKHRTKPAESTTEFP